MAAVILRSPTEADAIAITAIGRVRGRRQAVAAVPDFLEFLAEHGRVRTQWVIEPFQVLGWHRSVYAAMADRNIALKSREVGSSTFWVAVRVLDVLFNPPGDVLVAADRMDNATNLVSYARVLLAHLPSDCRPRLTKDNVAELEFDCDGLRSSIEAIPGTPESGRSYRCRHLICTEMGFWRDDEDYWNAVSGAVAAGGTIACESTWPRKGVRSVYGRIWDEAEARGYARHFVGRREVPWHTPEWEAQRRAEMTGSGFAREYPATAQEAIAAPIEGGLFRREWFLIVGEVPAKARRCRYWDLAASVSGDWTAGALLAQSDGVWYVEDMRRMRGTPGQVEALVRQTAELDGVRVPVWMEQEPGSSGVNTIDHYARRVLVGFTFRGDRATGNKIERMNPLAAAAEAGNVRLVRGSWNAVFLAEAEAVPHGNYDDQVDAVAGAMSKLGQRGVFVG